jgi:hypothetical protein
MRKQHLLLATGLTIAGALAGFGLKTVLADGVPAPNPLYYSGTLTEAGSPVNGPRQITVNLWPNQAATPGEPLLCTTATTTPVVNGRFRIALDGSCKGAVNANPNVFVEVLDDKASVGRSPVGAVPYAVEADHAVTASNAADGGSIAAALATLHPPSAFSAVLTVPKNFTSGAQDTIVFDQVGFDLGNEYDNTTGTFTPKRSGYYLVHCVVEFSGTGAGDYAVNIYKNKAAVAAGDLVVANGASISLQVNEVIPFAANDAVTCGTFQTTGGSVDEMGNELRNTFSVTRVY